MTWYLANEAGNRWLLVVCLCVCVCVFKQHSEYLTEKQEIELILFPGIEILCVGGWRGLTSTDNYWEIKERLDRVSPQTPTESALWTVCRKNYRTSSKLQGSHRSGKSGNSGKILKTFSSQGNQEKTGGFQPKSGKKFQIRELFSKPFSNLLNPKIWGQCFLRLKSQELSGNCT